MLTINVRHVGEAFVFDLSGTLLLPGDDVALLEAVSHCASKGGRLVVLNFAGVGRIDAAGLGALIRSRRLLAALDGELRIVNPTKFVGEILRRTRLDSVIKMFHVWPGDQVHSGDGGPVGVSAAAAQQRSSSLLDCTA